MKRINQSGAANRLWTPGRKRRIWLQISHRSSCRRTTGRFWSQKGGQLERHHSWSIWSTSHANVCLCRTGPGKRNKFNLNDDHSLNEASDSRSEIPKLRHPIMTNFKFLLDPLHFVSNAQQLIIVIIFIFKVFLQVAYLSWSEWNLFLVIL